MDDPRFIAFREAIKHNRDALDAFFSTLYDAEAAMFFATQEADTNAREQAYNRFKALQNVHGHFVNLIESNDDAD